MITWWPRKRRIRASASPITVERMWPTCIGLATFGELKSTTIVRGAAVASTPQRSSRTAAAPAAASASSRTRTFTKPGPAGSPGGAKSRPKAGSAASRRPISAARSRGLRPARFASAIAIVPE